MITAQKIAEAMGGRAVFRREFRSMHELDQLISNGKMPRRALDVLARKLSDETAFKYSIMPKASYTRHESLPTKHAQSTERLARIFALAVEIWRDEPDARRFLAAPHPELGGDTPLTRARSEIGAREVEEVLDRARYGFPV
jgi:putative toxin-antitoxin system antitoxin component (TIGR02293 family)